MDIEHSLIVLNYSPLGRQWVNELDGVVIHSKYRVALHEDFKVYYHSANYYKALEDPEVKPYLQAIGLGIVLDKFPCYLDIKAVTQFVKNYNRTTNETYIEDVQGVKRKLHLNIDVVRNAYNLPVVKEGYKNYRKLDEWLEGLVDQNGAKYKGGIPIVADIKNQKYIKLAWALRFLTKVEPSNHHGVTLPSHLARLYKPEVQTTNWSTLR